MAIEDFLIPPWLLEHPEIQRRGIKLTDTLWPGKVFATEQGEPMGKVVKILDPSTNEADILEYLMEDMACPASHIAPCEVVRTGDKLLGIMPRLDSVIGMTIRVPDIDILSFYLDFFDQLLEGIIYLHDRGVAHMDLYSQNVLCWGDGEPSDPRLRRHSLYIIDFDHSRKLDLKPGVQGAVALGGPAYDPPKGITHLDPYSWDVFCAGKWLHSRVRVHWSPDKQKFPHHLVSKYAGWVMGDERGCVGVCHCRPTPRRARQVLRLVRWVYKALAFCTAALGRLAFIQIWLRNLGHRYIDSQ